MAGSDDLTHDAFLGGRLRLWQPKSGYRAGVDPVLLAAATPAKRGQTVLELGCGVGAAALCLHRRVADLRITGVELQPDYAALARRNGEEAAACFEVVVADLRALPSELRQRRFDHVIMNPPYYTSDKTTTTSNDGKAIAFAGETAIADWLDAGIRRIAPRGYLTLIQKADRLPEVLDGINDRLGSIVVQPVSPRQGRVANLVIVQAKQEGRAPFRLNAPHIMHVGDSHDGDRESYSTATRAILREAAPFRIAD